MNEGLLFIELIIIFGILVLSKKFFGKTGVFVWIGVATILANIQVTKQIDIFGLKGTLGNVLFGSTFLATDILAECYGKKNAKKGVYIGLFFAIAYIIISQVTLLFVPNDIDTAHKPMEELFSISLRVSISSITMFFIANMADVYLFDKIKEKTKGKMLWLRNNVATIVCNVIENFFFVTFAFMGIFSMQDILIIALSTSILEIIIAICDTPFLYIAKNKIIDKE